MKIMGIRLIKRLFNFECILIIIKIKIYHEIIIIIFLLYYLYDTKNILNYNKY